MFIYNDLSLYSDDHFENAYNVGWIDTQKKLSEEPVNTLLLDCLSEYLKHPVNTVRGNSNICKWRYREDEYILGFSEIRVITDNEVYASPNRILYSISEQGYNPPKQFVDAVINGINPDLKEYSSFLENYNERNFWGASEKQKEASAMAEKFLCSGDIHGLMKFLDENPENINTVTKSGSLLNYAIKSGNMEIAFQLIDKGFLLNNYNGLELLSALETDMDEVSDKLIDCNIPMNTLFLKRNPLFVAVAYKKNKIAERLYLEYPDLRKKYSDEFRKDCDILQWSAICDNIEMFAFIRKQLEGINESN